MKKEDYYYYTPDCGILRSHYNNSFLPRIGFNVLVTFSPEEKENSSVSFISYLEVNRFSKIFIKN